MGSKGYQFQPKFLFWVRLKTLQSSNQISQILQIAYLFSDMKLTICQSGSHIVIYCDSQTLQMAKLQDLNLIKQKGLYEACINSKIALKDAQEFIIKDIQFKKIARGQLVAAGKQIHLTKYALMRHMPRLHDFLHYRIFDVDSVKFVIQRFKSLYPEEGNKAIESQQQAKIKNFERRANDQVWQDMNEMHFYYQHALNDY